MEFEMDVKKVSKKFRVKDHICNAWKNITVEPVLICFMLPFCMSALTIQNLSLEKACRVNLNLDTSICDAIQKHNHSAYNETDEVASQKIVAAAYVWKNIVYSLFPAVLLPLFGSWCDRNKTMRVLMLMPIIGEVITNIGFILCTFYFYELPMEVNTLVEVLPTALTGGSNMLLLGVVTYVTTVTTNEGRTIRIGIVHILINVCTTIGNALSGVIYKLIGFYGVFTLALIMYASGGLYAYYVVQVASENSEKSLTNFQLIKDIANIKETVQNFKFLVKPNRGEQLKQICVILVLAVLVLGPVIGEGTVMYMYTRLKFSWGEIDYSLYNTYNGISHLIGNTVGMIILSKWLKCDDAILGIVSSISKICGSAIYVAASTVVVFYLGTFVDLLNGTAFIGSRSIITKLVDEQDLGKVNSLFGIAESVTNLIYGPMYSALYKGTADSFPGWFFILGIALTVPAILMYTWLYVRRGKRIPTDSVK